VSGTVEVRLAAPDDWADWRLLRRRSLTEDRDVFSASTTLWSGADDSEDRWRARVADGPCFIAYDGDDPVGMVGGQVVDGEAQLISMWVAPEARRRGIGRALVDAVVAWSAGRPLALRVMHGNDPAIRAYEEQGFVLQPGDPDCEGCQRMLRGA
jgi:ribosomal protein S18 acetylase RimI-like enzyme